MCSYVVLLFRGSPSVECVDHNSESNTFSFAVIFCCIPDQAQETPASPILLPMSVAKKNIFKFDLLWQSLCNFSAALKRFAHVPGVLRSKCFRVWCTH